MAFHKLLTNIPVVGTVRFMDYRPERDVEKDGKSFHFYPQIALNGTWDGIGEAKIEMSAAVATSILKDGLAELKDGNDKEFRWLYKGKVQILKAEEGKTKRTTVLALDAQPKAAAPVAVNGQPPKATTVAPGGDPWVQLGESYMKSKALAIHLWGADFNPAALVAAVATIFIEANKRGLTIPPTAQQTAEKIRTTFDNFDQPPPALAKSIKGEPDDALPW